MLNNTQEYRILVCPNAFKGSLTAVQAAQAISEGILRANQADSTNPGRIKPALTTVSLPLADGGDGTLETLVAATGGTIHHTTVHGPLGAPVRASWGRLGGDRQDTAIIEMAQASGLRLLRPEEYDPLRANTHGTGELMRAALDAGCRTLLVGIGGSATNDGGAGMARALGARLLDTQGQELEPGGAALRALARIDLTEFALPADTQVIIASDVDNPLCGPEGASAIYGPQKGATTEMVRTLDAALSHYSDILRSQLGADVAKKPGAGAAGGLGAGLMAFCHATLRAGTELVLDATGFDVRCSQCQLALTGEGRMDAQTARGKVIAGVARRARAAGVPAIALVGALEEETEALLRNEGLVAAMSIVEGPLPLEEAMQQAYRLLSSASERLARFVTLWL